MLSPSRRASSSVCVFPVTLLTPGLTDVSLSPDPSAGVTSSGPRHGAGSFLSVSRTAGLRECSPDRRAQVDQKCAHTELPVSAPQGPKVQFASARGLVPTPLLASLGRWCGEVGVMVIASMMTVTRLSHSGSVPGTVLVLFTTLSHLTPKSPPG